MKSDYKYDTCYKHNAYDSENMKSIKALTMFHKYRLSYKSLRYLYLNVYPRSITRMNQLSIGQFSATPIYKLIFNMYKIYVIMIIY